MARTDEEFALLEARRQKEIQKIINSPDPYAKGKSPEELDKEIFPGSETDGANEQDNATDGDNKNDNGDTKKGTDIIKAEKTEGKKGTAAVKAEETEGKKETATVKAEEAEGKKGTAIIKAEETEGKKGTAIIKTEEADSKKETDIIKAEETDSKKETDLVQTETKETSETKKEETVATAETSGEIKKEETGIIESQKETDLVQTETETKKEEKKEKVLTPEELAKKLEQEKEERKKAAKILKYKAGIENDLELQRKQRIEKKATKQSIITNGAVFVGGIGVSVALTALVMPYLIGLALPIAVITGLSIFKAVKKLPKLDNPYELRKIIIIEQAKIEHETRNKKIIEAYKAEKKRIKSLKRLPYKILNTFNFIISMFTLIFFFFILDLGIKVTALILFSVFTVLYFILGAIMFGVFYMISENKQRDLSMKLEIEKNRLLVEEQIRSENAIRKKLDAERRRYEEEERLRIEEQIRVQKEIEEDAIRMQIEAEERAIEVERKRIRAEEKAAEKERRRIEAERKAAEEKAEEERKKAEKKAAKERKKAEKAAERERLMQELQNRRTIIKQVLPPPAPTKAEITKESEIIKNEFDKQIFEEINSNIDLDDLDVSGIEEFTNKSKIASEYKPSQMFHNVDPSIEAIETEHGGLLFERPNVLFNEKDIIEKEATVVNQETKETEIKTDKPIENKPPSVLDEDDDLNKVMLSEIEKTPTTPTVNKGVSGKSFMVLKKMLKDDD